jgi:hypothetical protein
MRSHTANRRAMSDAESARGSTAIQQDHVHTGETMGDTGSVGGSAAIQPEHIHTVGGQWEIQSQGVVLRRSSDITYFL